MEGLNSRERLAVVLAGHQHCLSCFAVTCNYKFLAEIDTSEFGEDDGMEDYCPIVPCRNSCGAKLHKCKESDHVELCPYETVPCINMENGCPKMLARQNMASHLPICPAWVVVCTNERGYAPKPSCENIVAGEHLDLQLAFHDQANLKNAIYPTVLLKFLGGQKLAQRMQDHEERLKMISGFVNKNVDFNEPAPLVLNPTLEFGSRYHLGSGNKYIFVCGCEVRRDMYDTHIQDVHQDIVSGLNNWLFEKCPLQSLGCMFSRARLFPDAPTCTLVFLPTLHTFSVKHEVTPRLLETDKNHLLTLPPELLIMILEYLDSLSLFNLSLTCKPLRDFCRNLFLIKKGIVTVVWKKSHGTRKWEVSGTAWTFPKHFCPIKKWGLRDNPSMAAHLAKCAYNDRCEHSDDTLYFKLIPHLQQVLSAKVRHD